MLFPLGASYALFESVGKLQDPQPMAHPGWAAATLAAAMAFEGASLAIAIRQARRAGGRRSLWRYVRETRSPDIAAVLVEDLGAVIGLALALAAVAAASLTGDPRYDAWGGVAVSVLLLAMAGMLAVEVKSLVIGESATPEELVALRRSLGRPGEVRSVGVLRTMHLAPDQVLVVARLEFEEALRVPEVEAAIRALQESVPGELPWVRVLHVEPGPPSPQGANGARSA